LLIARSAGFRDAWRAEAESLVYGFGDRPGSTSCPLAVFAKPIGARHVAIVRVSDARPGYPGGLRFHFLVVDRKTYESVDLRSVHPPPKSSNRFGGADPLPRIMIPERFFPRGPSCRQNVLKRIRRRH